RFEERSASGRRGRLLLLRHQDLHLLLPRVDTSGHLRHRHHLGRRPEIGLRVHHPREWRGRRSGTMGWSVTRGTPTAHHLPPTSADGPKSVYAFITRESGGYEIKDDWDALGQRASQSCTTILNGAHASADRVVRRLDPGPNPDPLIFGIFACFELLLASVYTGVAQRALDVAVATVGKRTSMKNDGAPYSHDPDIRWRIADAGIALDGVYPQIDALAKDVDELADHGSLWFPRLSAAKVRATETAKDVVDAAIRVSGGGSYLNRSELSRLYRDVLAGLFHPSD